MKTLALIVRRPDTSRDSFGEHYEQVHAPLAVRTLLEETTRYVRHHLRKELHGRPAFDVVSAFWYRDAAAAIGVQRRLSALGGEAILRDERRGADTVPTLGDASDPAKDHPTFTGSFPRSSAASTFAKRSAISGENSGCVNT